MTFSKLVELKSPSEIAIMKEASTINLQIINEAKAQIKVGMSTQDLDTIIGNLISKYKVLPAFLNYQPDPNKPSFSGNACICVNEEVFHATPNSAKIIKSGDMITIDMGIKHKGFFADSADTFVIGHCTDTQLKLIQAAKEAFNRAVPLCSIGNSTEHITRAIDMTIRSYGFHPVPGYGGHGVGSSLHMSPFIGNTISESVDCELCEGTILCLEPACSIYAERPQVGPDKWTVELSPTNLSSHYERMVQVGPGGGIVL